MMELLSPPALLVIDAQESFKAQARWSRRSNPAFEDHVARLVRAFRDARRPIAWFLHTDPDPGFQEGNPLLRIFDEFVRSDGEPLWVKRTRNCFTSTPLQPWLLQRGVRRIAICGIQTEQCCETTTRVAADLGFEVDFVTEATLTFPIAHPDFAGRELSTDAIVERTEYALRGRFARIATVDTLERELQDAACAA